MNLVMDDFYHAHAHSLRLMCIEGCGSFVTSSQAGDYTLTRTGNTEETRNGDVTRTITGNVNESIKNGSVTINNNLMGKKTTEVISGNQDYVATVSGNFTENLAVTGNYSKVITASAISEVNTGAQTQVKSDENKTILGMDYETYCGVKLPLSLAVNFDLFAGQKTEIYAGPKIVDKKIYIRKSATSLDQGEAFLTDRKIGKLGYKLTIIG